MAILSSNLRFVPLSDCEEKFFDVYLRGNLIGEIKYSPDEERCYFKATCICTYFTDLDMLSIIHRMSELTLICNRKRTYERLYES